MLVSVLQTLAIVGVGVAELFLIRELRETRRFLARINDNVLGAVAANMALNTGLAVAQAIITKERKDDGH